MHRPSFINDRLTQPARLQSAPADNSRSNQIPSSPDAHQSNQENEGNDNPGGYGNGFFDEVNWVIDFIIN